MNDIKCKCGKILEVKYICGFGGNSNPHYYVKCECGFYDEENIYASTVTARDKAKLKLIKKLKSLEVQAHE